MPKYLSTAGQAVHSQHRCPHQKVVGPKASAPAGTWHLSQSTWHTEVSPSWPWEGLAKTKAAACWSPAEAMLSGPQVLAQQNWACSCLGAGSVSLMQTGDQGNQGSAPRKPSSEPKNGRVMAKKPTAITYAERTSSRYGRAFEKPFFTSKVSIMSKTGMAYTWKDPMTWTTTCKARILCHNCEVAGWPAWIAHSVQISFTHAVGGQVCLVMLAVSAIHLGGCVAAHHHVSSNQEASWHAAFECRSNQHVITHIVACNVQR